MSYIEINSVFSFPLEKIGTNRRLLDRKALFDFKKPFDGSTSLTINPERSRRIDLIPVYKGSYEKEIFAQERALALSCSSKNTQSQIWSRLLYAARTYFESLVTEI